MEGDIADGPDGREIEKTHRRRYQPYKFSGKSYSFDFQQEKQIVDRLRSWQDKYFNRCSWIFRKMSRKLGELRTTENATMNYEFDLLVKVLRIFEKDEYNLELRIKDLSNELWFIVIPKLKFGRFREGEIIRIRSVNINVTSKRNVIQVRQSTNILRFT
mmetsp:Transcript_2145/g.3206  ORF Transcript_2145/g.3206 Transcript_2145/m.3206 type:complete len:159 (+) Transcript_2145:449-925(+)